MRAIDRGSDQLSIETPELVTIDMPLAGIGSRFIALLVDYLIWAAAALVLTFLGFLILPAISTFSRPSVQWAVAAAIFAIFFVNWGYFTLFEAFWNGRTPGKRVACIRVIQRSGRAIGLFESMARNLLRYIDQIPFPLHAVGVIAMFATPQHQRLGDMVAGTLVVRDREDDAPLWGETGARTLTAAVFAPAPQASAQSALPVLSSASIAKLSAADLQVLEEFFARRLDMPPSTRQTLARRIAAAIQLKSGAEIPPGASIETFLEATAHQLRDLARLR